MQHGIIAESHNRFSTWLIFMPNDGCCNSDAILQSCMIDWQSAVQQSMRAKANMQHSKLHNRLISNKSKQLRQNVRQHLAAIGRPDREG